MRSTNDPPLPRLPPDANTALVRNNNIASPTFNAIAQNLSPRIFRVGVVVGF